MRKAVLTYIIGGYDSLKDPEIVTPGWDYFCVSDAEVSSSIWRQLPLLASVDVTTCPKRHSSFIKIMHHLYVPDDYDLCMTIDGSMKIRCDLDCFLKEIWTTGADMAIARHPRRNCLYREAAAVLALQLDDRQLVQAQTARYRAEGFPEDCGLYGARLIVKNNRSASLREMNSLWAQEVLSGSRRDQLSLTYALWKHARETGRQIQIATFDFEDVYRARKLFEIMPHLESAVYTIA